MNINWKLRLQNKTTLLALLASISSLVYILLGIAGITPSIAESEMNEWLAAAVNLLVMLGVVVDPTTKGIGDSQRALGYEKPCVDCEEKQQ